MCVPLPARRVQKDVLADVVHLSFVANDALPIIALPDTALSVQRLVDAPRGLGFVGPNNRAQRPRNRTAERGFARFRRRCVRVWRRCVRVWRRCVRVWRRCVRVWRRCVRVWRRCVRWGLAPVCALGFGAGVCVGVWRRCVRWGLAPVCALGFGAGVCVGVWRRQTPTYPVMGDVRPPASAQGSKGCIGGRCSSLVRRE
jgi:hypothetical protein